MHGHATMHIETLCCPPSIPSRSLKDILYRKRMERELLRAKGLLKGAEKPPDEVRPPAAAVPCRKWTRSLKPSLAHHRPPASHPALLTQSCSLTSLFRRVRVAALSPLCQRQRQEATSPHPCATADPGQPWATHAAGVATSGGRRTLCASPTCQTMSPSKISR